jgi:hypothetical protein
MSSSSVKSGSPSRVESPDGGGTSAAEAAASARGFIVLDTLGKLYAHGHGIGSYCLVCQRVFLVLLPSLITERGGDARVAGMNPLMCPGCQERRTTFQITAPAKGWRLRPPRPIAG